MNSKANTSALSSYVPTTRTVNGKALSSNITLSASDVTNAASKDPASVDGALLIDKYLWKKQQVIAASYTTGSAVSTQITTGTSTSTSTQIKYATSVSVSDAGVVSLNNPSTYSATYSNYTTVQSYIRGKYFTTAFNDHSVIYYVTSSATVTRSTSPYRTFVPAAVVTGIPKAYGSVSYEYGTSSSHTDGSESGGYLWTDIGKYADNIYENSKGSIIYTAQPSSTSGTNVLGVNSPQNAVSNNYVWRTGYSAGNYYIEVLDLKTFTVLGHQVVYSGADTSSGVSHHCYLYGQEYDVPYILYAIYQSTGYHALFLLTYNGSLISMKRIESWTDSRNMRSLRYASEEYVLTTSTYSSTHQHYLYDISAGTDTMISAISTSDMIYGCYINDGYIYYWKTTGLYRLKIDSITTSGAEELIQSEASTYATSSQLIYRVGDVAMWLLGKVVYMYNGQNLISTTLTWVTQSSDYTYSLVQLGKYNGKHYFLSPVNGSLFEVTPPTDLSWLNNSPLKTIPSPKFSASSGIIESKDFSNIGFNPRLKFNFKKMSFYYLLVDTYMSGPVNGVSFGIKSNNTIKLGTYNANSSSNSAYLCYVP